MYLRNPIGFAPGDFIELGVAAALVLLAFLWEPFLDRFARHTPVWMVIIAILPVAIRLAFLPHYPVPVPDIYDEFGHLFVADTLRHFRLSNPPNALPQFFETFFIFQRPTYSSIYPPGQGLVLLFGWAGVVITTAAFCALCYWMLLGWTTPRWALVGGLLAVMEFGPLSQWMNSYWGGSFAAAAGCLVFGALPRKKPVILGIGIALNLITRPFETVFLVIAVLAYGLPIRKLLIAGLVVLPATGLMLAQNRSVTGNWTTLPYSLSQYQYGVPASLTFQTQAIPHNKLTREQDLEYRSQLAFSSGSYFKRLVYRIRYYRFYFYAPLYLALLAFLVTIRTYRYLWVAGTALLFALGTNFFPAFQYHYLAAIVCLFILMSVTGLERLPAKAATVIIGLSMAQFATGHVEERIPERRIAVARQVEKIPGKLLIFVRYWPNHIFQDEWVYNAADLNSARVIWARDLGEPEDEKLRNAYPDRAVWLLEPDAIPPALAPYKKPEPPPPPVPEKKPITPGLVLENVPQ